MPVLDSEPYVKGAIASILGQTFQDFEFIIVDGGSTDGTRAILADYERLDDRLRVYYDNLDLPSSLAHGCSLARGTFIARMDADDVSLPDRLAKQIGFLERNPSVVLLGGSIKVIDNNGNHLHTVDYPANASQIRESLMSYNCIAHPTVLMRRDAYFAVGGYRETFPGAEDYDLWLRMADRYDLGNLEDTLLYYRIKPGQRDAGAIEKQLRSILAAQATAKARRETGRDPAQNFEIVTTSMLEFLGVSGEDLVHAFVEFSVGYAGLMAGIGRVGAALETLDTAESRCRHQSIPKETLADLHWAYSRVHWKRGDLFKSFLSMTKSCLSQPVASFVKISTVLARQLQNPAHSTWGRTEHNLNPNNYSRV